MTPFVPGVYTALVTPFTADASAVDWEAFERLVDVQVRGGVSAVIPCGTTGESPTLSDAEQRELVARTVKLAKGRARVIVGSGTNDTKKTIQASRAAFELGADAVMLVTPYYSRPSQDGLFRHVTTVARDVSGPVMLYNIPHRAGIDLSVDTVLRILDACPNVTGIKDASGNVLYIQELLQRASGRIEVFSGDDVLTLPLMSVGARGIISVASNLYPREVGRVVTDALNGRFDEARTAHARLYPLYRALFSEPNPQPIKAALASKGIMTPAVRLPLVEASEECRSRLSDVMRSYEAAP